MKKDTVLNVALAIVGLALSLFLAIGGYPLYDDFGIPTPGVLAARTLVPTSPKDLLGNQLGTQMAVDWIFWFAVMLAIYLMVTALGRRLKVPRH
jgi:hypothetical protein